MRSPAPCTANAQLAQTHMPVQNECVVVQPLIHISSLFPPHSRHTCRDARSSFPGWSRAQPMPNLHRRTCPCKTNALWFSLSYASPHSFLLTRVTLAGMHGPAFLAGHVHSQCPTCIDAHARAKRMRCGSASHTHLLTLSSSLASHLQGCTVQLSWLVTCTANAQLAQTHMPVQNKCVVVQPLIRISSLFPPHSRHTCRDARSSFPGWSRAQLMRECPKCANVCTCRSCLRKVRDCVLALLSCVCVCVCFCHCLCVIY